MQEWVTVIIVLLIVAILLDGVRRMRIAQRDKIRMSRSIYKKPNAVNEDAAKDFYPSELPNGGARVISKRESSQLQREAKKSQAQKGFRNRGRTPEQAHLHLDEPVPLLMESVIDDVLLGKREPGEPGAQQAAYRPQPESRRDSQGRGMNNNRIEPTFAAADELGHPANSARDTYPEPEAADARYEPLELDADENRHPEADDEPAMDDDDYQNDQGYEDEEDYQDEDGYQSDDGYDDEDDDYAEDDEEHDEKPAPLAANQIPPEPEEVLIINIMAFKGETFNGSDLLDIVLKCGMRYGDMDIFHRYSDAKGEGALLFSMANMVKPGTFDLDAMEQFETPGVSLFMTLPLKADSMQSFDLMVDTARAIADTLDGELKDEQRSVMTRQTIEHCRQRIRDFELKRLSRARH